jgi:hypothetical protein
VQLGLTAHHARKDLAAAQHGRGHLVAGALDTEYEHGFMRLAARGRTAAATRVNSARLRLAARGRTAAC